MNELDTDLHYIYRLDLPLDQKLAKAKAIIHIYTRLEQGDDVKLLRILRDGILGGGTK